MRDARHRRDRNDAPLMSEEGLTPRNAPLGLQDLSVVHAAKHYHPLRGWGEAFGFLTTEANAIVAAIHPKAMPVILTRPVEVDRWLAAEIPEAMELQRPLAENALQIVAKGQREDGASARLPDLSQDCGRSQKGAPRPGNGTRLRICRWDAKRAIRKRQGKNQFLRGGQSNHAHATVAVCTLNVASGSTVAPISLRLGDVLRGRQRGSPMRAATWVGRATATNKYPVSILFLRAS